MAREQKTIWVVQCAKLGKELPALERPPFPGELGERIFNEVSAMGWEMWREHSSLLINHYGLNMADPRAQEFLYEQMEEFLFGGGGATPAAPPAAPRKK